MYPLRRATRSSAPGSARCIAAAHAERRPATARWPDKALAAPYTGHSIGGSAGPARWPALAVCAGATPATAPDRGWRCTCHGHAPPGYEPRRPAPQRAIGWPVSARTAGHERRNNSCSRPPAHRPSEPFPAPGSTGRPGVPGPPRAGLPGPATATGLQPHAPPAGGRRSLGPMGRHRHGRLCRGARRPCRGQSVPGCAARAAAWPG
ncbi:hypothetical protein D3C81_1408340 [compost metagenome]